MVSLPSIRQYLYCLRKNTRDNISFLVVQYLRSLLLKHQPQYAATCSVPSFLSCESTGQIAMSLASVSKRNGAADVDVLGSFKIAAEHSSFFNVWRAFSHCPV